MLAIAHKDKIIENTTAELTELVSDLKKDYPGLEGNVVPRYGIQTVVVSLRDDDLRQRAGSVYPTMWNGDFGYIDARLLDESHFNLEYHFGFGKWAPQEENASQAIPTDANAFLLAHLFSEGTRLRCWHRLRRNLYFGTTVAGAHDGLIGEVANGLLTPSKQIESVVRAYLDLMNEYYPEKTQPKIQTH